MRKLTRKKTGTRMPKQPWGLNGERREKGNKRTEVGISFSYLVPIILPSILHNRYSWYTLPLLEIPEATFSQMLSMFYFLPRFFLVWDYVIMLSH